MLHLMSNGSTKPKKPTVQMPDELREYFRQCGRLGGLKRGKRKLTPEQARAMVAARERKRRAKRLKNSR
jgi:hypothetical protein